MDRGTPSQYIMRKYQEMGFDRHHILEAWTGCPENETIFLSSLLKIRSRDQLYSEQRFVWDGKRAPIKRIVNQTKLKKLAIIKIPHRDALEEFWELRKKGLLLKKEYRGHRGLDLKYEMQYCGLTPLHYQKDIKEMKGYLRRLRHVSIKFDFNSGYFYSQLGATIVPLLKSMKRSFLGLVSLKISLRFTSRWFLGDLQHFEKLMRRLGPTLKHLNLDFAHANNFGVKFLHVLGQIIMRNLHRLETLCLNFGDQTFQVDVVVAFFFNKVCPRMPNLNKLNLQMANCFADWSWGFFNQTCSTNNLRSLVLNLDHCRNLRSDHFFVTQRNIAIVCPSLEELYIRLPDSDRFSSSFLSDIEKNLLQKLNLKRLFIERSLEETLKNYVYMQTEVIDEETTMEELLREYMPKGVREEDVGPLLEVLDEDQAHFDYFDWPSFLSELDEMLREVEAEKEYMERKEIEEQEEAEMILRGDLTQNEEWTGVNVMHEMEDLYEEDDEQDHLLIELEGEQEEKKRNEIEEQDEAERILNGDLVGEERELENDMMNLWNCDEEEEE